MTYPAVTTPYGFRAVNSVDGKPYAGATRQLKIRNTKDSMGSPAADPIYYGDIVYFTTNPEATTGARLVRMDSGASYSNLYGVFMGCAFTNPVTKQPTFSQFWPGPNAAPDAVAYIIDDPMALYKVVAVSAAGEVDQVVVPTEYWAIGMKLDVNLDFNGDAGSTYSGDSYMSVISPSSSWSGYSSRILVVDVVPETKTDTGYPELLVKIVNPFLGSDNPNTNQPPLLLG